MIEPTVEALADALDQGGYVAMHAARIVVAATVQHGWEDPDAIGERDLDGLRPEEMEHALASELAHKLGLDRTEVLAAIREPGEGDAQSRDDWQRKLAREAEATGAAGC